MGSLLKDVLIKSIALEIEILRRKGLVPSIDIENRIIDLIHENEDPTTIINICALVGTHPNLSRARRELATKLLNKNIVEPISTLFHGLTADAEIDEASRRQLLKIFRE